ncbi:MAG: terminase small subunit [Sneathiella sp.]
MTQGASKKKKQGRLVSLAELANIFGCTDPTIRGYIKSGMPVKSKGQSGRGYELDTADCIRWLTLNAQQTSVGQKSDYDLDRARKMSADADKAEMDRDMMRGDLVEVDIAVGLVADRLQTLRSRMLNLPSKMATKLAALMKREDCLEYLEKEFNQLLKELSSGTTDG